MFDIIMRPVNAALAAAEEWAAHKLREAFHRGFAKGASAAAADLEQFASGLTVANGKPKAIPVMPSTAQVTTVAADDDALAKVAKAKELMVAGHSQRSAADAVGMPESTLRSKLKGGA